MRIPELVQGVDVLSLPLSALEGFVLSRIDGRAPTKEILAVTGLPEEQVVQILERLRGLGAVRWKGEASLPPNPAVQMGHAAPIPAAPQRPDRPSSTAPTSFPPAVPFVTRSPTPIPSRYPLSELAEDCDLPLERRRQLLDLFYRLSELDYYEALEIPYDADKKAVRSAYFALSKTFHPDTFFRKNLGSFKAKMEAVFKFLTEGYETLGKKKLRDEYDAYLRATKATAMAERALSMSTTPRASVGPDGEAHGAPPNPADVPPPPAIPAEWQVTAPAPAQEPVKTERSEQARRLAHESAARRLRAAISTPAQAPAADQTKTSKPASDPQQILLRLGRALRESHDLTGGKGRVEHCLRLSHEALARDDIQGAAEALRSALALAPERQDIRTAYERIARQVSEKLAGEYIVQAQFAAKQGKWASAALAWRKVCDGRPEDAGAHRSAAAALFKVGGDLRSAQKYAQRAVLLAPTDIEARVILAQLYLTLGLKLNAKRELDAALKLDPASEIVKNLLTDLKS